MTLPAPKLDARRFDDLVAEALRRVPAYTPEWTNYNQSDPGRALIEVNAWLTESLLYQINRVPDQNYVAFLNLLGITQRPARAAVAELNFALAKLDKVTDPLQVMLPIATQVAVVDPDLDADVVFETVGSATALNAAVGMALVPETGADGQWTPVVSFDSEVGKPKWLHSFNPFGATEVVGRQFILGLVLRPTIKGKVGDYSQDRMPSGPLDFYINGTEVFDAAPDGSDIAGPLTRVAGPVAAPPNTQPAATWEVFTGAQSSQMEFGGSDGWQKLGVSLDETEAMVRSGHVTVEMPANATPVRFGDLQKNEWAALRLRKPPESADEFAAALREVQDGLGERLRLALDKNTWAAMGVSTAQFNDVLSVCTTASAVASKITRISNAVPAEIDVSPNAIDPAVWGEILADFRAPDIPMGVDENDAAMYRRMYFLRVTLNTTAPTPRMVNAISLNTVRAIAATSRRDERLGVSNGRPGQSFKMSQAPVYYDPLTETPDMELVVEAGGEIQPWTRVESFFGHAADARVFTLDPVNGTVTFGDGRPKGRGGAIPPPGATVRVVRYRYGGGAVANVGSGAISKIKGSLTGVSGVSNQRPASGGADAESFDQVLGRAPSTLRSRDRAVSAQDFADLARQTPDAAIHKAYAIAAHAMVGGALEPRAGAVTLVVLPDRNHPTPQPTDADLSAVQRWLEPRRLVTTELHITGPSYFGIKRLSAQLRLSQGHDFQTVSQAARKAVADWLHPVHGGDDGTGWPFGTDIYYGDLYDLLLAVPGVRRVSGLNVDHDVVSEASPDDVIPIPEGALPALLPGAIDFEVRYDR